LFEQSCVKHILLLLNVFQAHEVAVLEKTHLLRDWPLGADLTQPMCLFAINMNEHLNFAKQSRYKLLCRDGKELSLFGFGLVWVLV